MGIAVSAVLGAASSAALAGIRMSSGPSLLFGTCLTVSGSILYTAVLASMNEYFPTQVRGVATGGAIFIGRSGSILAPLIYDSAGQKAFLMFFAGAMSAAGGVVALLPETKGEPLQDFVNEPPEEDRELEDMHGEDD